MTPHKTNRALGRALQLAGFLAVAAAGHLSAQTVNECDWVSSARNLVTPWSENIRDFANGRIRIALLDTYEPACCAFHLLVLSPDPEFGQACNVISQSPGQGWAGLRFQDLDSSYDPAKGLRINVEASHYDPETGATGRQERFGIRINQASGSVTIER